MGLDAVELLMTCEDEFGVVIPDEDAYKCTTPKVLAEYIYSRVRQSIDSPCPPQSGFYKLRKSLISSFNLKRSDIYPDSKLEQFFTNTTKECWHQLEKELNCGSLPRLEIGPRLHLFLYYLLPLSLITFLLVSDRALAFTALFIILYYVFVSNIAFRFGYCVPKKYSTVNDLIPLVSSSKTTVWSPEEILDRVMSLTSQQTGLELSKFTPDSHFINDIGLD